MAKTTKGRDGHATRGSSLHDCRMPFGYYAPRTFPKLLYEGVVFGFSREDWIGFFFRILCKTKVTYGQCGARMLDTIWTRDGVASLFDLAKAKGFRHLEDVMYREYHDRVLTCPACKHVAHLAWDGPTADDPSVPF